MYIIGVQDKGYLSILEHTLINPMDCKMQHIINRIWYNCLPKEATIFNSYEDAAKRIREIKKRESKIRMDCSGFHFNLSDESDESLDVNKLKIYALTPVECKDDL